MRCQGHVPSPGLVAKMQAGGAAAVSKITAAGGEAVSALVAKRKRATKFMHSSSKAAASLKSKVQTTWHRTAKTLKRPSWNCNQEDLPPRHSVLKVLRRLFSACRTS